MCRAWAQHINVSSGAWEIQRQTATEASRELPDGKQFFFLLLGSCGGTGRMLTGSTLGAKMRAETLYKVTPS